jgi:hypothetical protein
MLVRVKDFVKNLLDYKKELVNLLQNIFYRIGSWSSSHKEISEHIYSLFCKQDHFKGHHNTGHDDTRHNVTKYTITILNIITHSIECCYAECCYAECRVSHFLIVMLSDYLFIMLSGITLSVIMLIVIIQSVNMLNVVVTNGMLFIL